MDCGKQIFKLTIFYFTLSLFLCSTIAAQEEYSETINLIISNEILGDVNRTDARATIEAVMTEVLGKHRYTAEKIIPEIVASKDIISNMVKQNIGDIIGISILDYIELKKEIDISPVFMLQINATPGVNYVLIVKNDTKIKTFIDLKSKKVLTPDSFTKEIINMWLYVEMSKEKIIQPNQLINSFTKTPSPSKRIFSVFFGASDGCIVTRGEFESACDINPQLRKSLKILYESPNYLTHIFCSNNNSNKKSLSETINFIDNINRNENGSKMLRLFKTVTISSFKPEYIKTIDKLVEEYSNYSKKH